jgi:Mlc titration factor MtfA (ptsG expression regulator)
MLLRLWAAWRRPPPAVREADWQACYSALPILSRRPVHERLRLQQLALALLAEKSIEPVGELELGATETLALGLLAALPILNLGLDWYRGWHALVLYPDEFRSRFEEVDEAGVVHLVEDWRSGESWGRGPLILSLADVAAAGHGDGYNVVVHECAHKLDQLDGEANGRPPLHPDMAPAAWSDAFAAAFRDLRRRTLRRLQTAIDPYAAESPAEFFAVACEVFFDDPRRLQRGYPAVYEQLALFYRQDPAIYCPPPATP